MLDVLGALVRNLVVIIFTAVLLEMLLPQGRFNNYVRLITGMLVIMMVVNTISSLIGGVPQEGPDLTVFTPREEIDLLQERAQETSRRLVVSEYLSALEGLVASAIEEDGRWRGGETDIVLEEDRDRPHQVIPASIAVTVREQEVDVNTEELVAPVRIPSVQINGGEGSGDHLPVTRIGELEALLVRVLELPEDRIRVYFCD